MFQEETLEFSIGSKTLTFKTGKIARQANGSIFLQCGETIVFASACAASAPAEGIDFFPLRVDYQEKFSSAGKTLGGFLKREGRPSEREVLTSRLIDRPLRPLFEEGYYNEVQILSYVFSYDGHNTPDVLAICAASAALTISDIPLLKPIGAVRVGRIEGKFILNPSVEEMKKSSLDLVIAGTEDAILMIEGFCDFLTEEEVCEALEKGHEAIQIICRHLLAWQKKIGKEKKRGTLQLVPDHVQQAVDAHAAPLLRAALTISQKGERELAIAEIKESLLKLLFPEGQEPLYTKGHVALAFKKLQSTLMRKRVLEDKIRIDGRSLDAVRPIDIELGLLPRAHGSALFTRGETQSLAVCTLGGDSSGQRFEDLHGEGLQRFYLQYSFPPFSVGEVGRVGSPGRREVGHGKLAERSLGAMLPKKEEFPYVIRLESNITESNGSSSMASVCGGCLAAMQAGVPIKRPVAGIAMGLILEGDIFVILTDILGAEDALGDMDFKVAGDEHGITAFQMDIKVEGITLAILRAALAQAKKGRVWILGKMLQAIPKSAATMSPHAPRIETIQIHPSKIGTVIGPGGKQIRAIVEETGVQIDIDDSGVVSIVSSNGHAMNRAKEIVTNLTSELEIGKTYVGRVSGVVQFGLFVEIFGKEGLCHISEISTKRLPSIEDAPFKEGDTIEVKVLDIDRGKIRLSHRAVLEERQPV